MSNQVGVAFGETGSVEYRKAGEEVDGGRPGPHSAFPGRRSLWPCPRGVWVKGWEGHRSQTLPSAGGRLQRPGSFWVGGFDHTQGQWCGTRVPVWKMGQERPRPGLVTSGPRPIPQGAHVSSAKPRFSGRG